MATLDNRELSNGDKMLLPFARAFNNSVIYRPVLQKLSPILGASSLRSNLSTSPVTASNQTLPQLPVPALKDTLEKYLKSVVPFLSESELKQTTQIVKEFGKNGGCGEKLQALLVTKAKCTENWLAQWWLENAYLGFRSPVVIYSSPGLVFPMEKFRDVCDQLDYATKIIVSAMKYKEQIDNDKIPLEKMGKDPLDMGQYKKFFGTCRIPKPKLDGLEFHSKSQHIVVACNNHFFKLYPVNAKNEPLSERQIFEQLRKIMSLAVTKTSAVGILSSDSRDKWATSYATLIQDPQNAKSVDAIQKSLFLVCLDGPMPAQPVNRQTVAGGQCIHGGGSIANGGNRWFDKTVQFIVGHDGLVGLTYEHSPSEGQPIAVMTDFLIDHMCDKPLEDVASGVRDIEHLKFNMSPAICKAIDESSTALDNLVSNFDLQCHVFMSFGKTFIKSQKFSPDSFVQMAMQYGFYRLHNVPGAHYESAATRKYIGGRTETIRSCSDESVRFAKAMLDPNMSPMEKRSCMATAIAAHKKYTMEAVNGHGVDRHLLGLKLIALENGIAVPDIYNDKAFTESKHFRLSTSQVATRCPGFMCYGPIEDDGYGLCYNPRKDNIYYGVSSFVSNNTTDSMKMKEAFEQSLCDMHDVLVKSQQAKL
ncbi:Carnitine O-Acetyl-Transferase [Carabus blaptoides fortunei]